MGCYEQPAITAITPVMAAPITLSGDKQAAGGRNKHGRGDTSDKRGDGSGACALCSRHIKLGHSEREVIIYDWKVNNNHTLAGRTRRPPHPLAQPQPQTHPHPPSNSASHGKLSRDVLMADAKARKRPRVEWTAVEAVDGARVVYNRPCQNRPRTDARSFLETWSTWS